MNSNNKGVIILGGFIQGLALARSFSELGVPVYVADDKQCLAGFSRCCDKFIECPKTESSDFVPFLIEFAQKKELNDWLLVPTDDHQVDAISRNSTALGVYYRFLVPSQDTLELIINKKKLLEIAERSGTCFPKTCSSNDIDIAKEYRYPLLIKGTYGATFFRIMHKKGFVVDSYNELRSVFQDLSKTIAPEDIMIQELIPSRQIDHVVSFTCFSINGEIKTFWMGEKLRERPIDHGTATFAQSILNANILEQAKPLIQSLNYTGVCEIEFMYDYRDDCWCLIEINPRTWKWVGLAKECGIDFAKIMYRHVHDIPQDFPRCYDTNVKWVDMLTDIFSAFAMIRRRKLSFTKYLKSYRGKLVNAIWSWKDPAPALYFPIYALYRKASRLWKI